MAPLPIGGATIAIWASAPVAELHWPAGKEGGMSVSTHDTHLRIKPHGKPGQEAGWEKSDHRMLAEIEATSTKKFALAGGSIGSATGTRQEELVDQQAGEASGIVADDAVLLEEIVVEQAHVHFGNIGAIDLHGFGAFGAIAAGDLG